MAGYPSQHIPDNIRANHGYPPTQSAAIPSSLIPGQDPSAAPSQQSVPPFRRPLQHEKSQLTLPRRSPSMSARAQRELQNRQTYYEERGGLPSHQYAQPQPGYGSSSKMNDSSDTKMYSMDLERHAGSTSDHSHDSTPRSRSPDTTYRQQYDQDRRIDHEQTQPLAKRVSIQLGKRLSMMSFRGGNVPLTEMDEKRLQEEKLAHEEEERRLDEEEKEMLKKGLFNWTELRSWRFWIRKEWWKWYLILAICGVVAALFTIYHDKIVNWLTPYAQKLKELPGGWAIPIGILFVLSFPPLFGGEVICLLCGLVWGLWVGFAIVCAGTFLGEMGNFFLFKYTLRGYAAKLERKNLNYALMAHVIREGGFKVAMIARFSAIPGHFLTAIFSTCGMSVISFALGTALSLPKQLAIVYLGVLIGSKDQSSKDTIISYSVLAVSAIVTIGAMWYIYWKMNQAKLPVWRARRAALAGKGVDLSTLPKEPPTEDRAVTRPILLAKTSMDDGTDLMLYNAEAPAGGPRDNRYTDPYNAAGRGHAGYASHSSVDLTRREMDMGAIPLQSFDSRSSRNPGSTSQFPNPNPYIPPMARQPSDVSTYTTNAGPPGYLDPPMVSFPEPKLRPSPAQEMRQPDASNVRPRTDDRVRVSSVDPGANRI